MKEVDRKEYELSFFKENGFKRQKCKIGGEYFWSLGIHESCQDAPCTFYWFDRIKSPKPLSVMEARNLFLKFFEKNGHTVIKPRPVVARWRNDLFLTIASIVVFQPHVTNGLVPPPANPLVISQPSIRLEDIDNVGLTIGRHMTSFEMAAHHAFNYPDKFVYWKEKTVELAFRFFTEELKIPPELITFKESWWEGGGNAGPSFEVAVGGLELATLVFMQYKINGNRYEEIPLKIVDTGYGVERLSWFSSKTPTAFHAIFRDLVDKFRGLIGIDKPPEEILWAAFRFAGRMDPENPDSVTEYYTSISKKTGIDRKDVEKLLGLETSLYTLLDHTKTISLMLADGIVPSNSGEGYLARLVIRRALRQLWKLGSEVKLSELVELQTKYWKDSFPQLSYAYNYILEAVDLEEEKYKETLSKAPATIKKLIKKKKKIGLDDLIVLYESYGIPPDIVKLEAMKLGINIDLPYNFYTIIASRHQGVKDIGKKDEDQLGLPDDIIEWANTFPSTERIFHKDPYTRRFEAQIIGSRDKYVILDKTAFYPLGGGQQNDTGYLEINGTMYRVKEVYKTIRDVIIHVIDKPLTNHDENVIGIIDWERRYRLMRHHTGTHVIMGAARRVLGEHVWQAGAEKTPNKARLDITHHKPLTKEEIHRIEQLANQVIDERRPVKTLIMDRNKAEEKYGFRLYQGGVPKSPLIRIVDIEGWDTQACFGTHLTNTGEIGGLKIINVERLADGIVRLEFVAGTRVVEETSHLESIIDSLSKMLKADKKNLEKKMEKILKDYDEAQITIKKYRQVYIEQLLNQSKETIIGKLLIFTPIEENTKDIQELLRKLTDTDPSLIAIAMMEMDQNNSHIWIALGKIASKKTDAKRIAECLSSVYNGKGGGGQTFASIKIEKTIGLEELEKHVLQCLKSAS